MVTPRQLGGHDSPNALRVGLRNRPSDLALVLVVRRRVDQAVAEVEGGLHRPGGFRPLQWVGAETQGGQGRAVVQRQTPNVHVPIPPRRSELPSVSHQELRQEGQRGGLTVSSAR